MAEISHKITHRPPPSKKLLTDGSFSSKNTPRSAFICPFAEQRPHNRAPMDGNAGFRTSGLIRYGASRSDHRFGFWDRMRAALPEKGIHL
jgi:hypothetical protein